MTVTAEPTEAAYLSRRGTDNGISQILLFIHEATKTENSAAVQSVKSWSKVKLLKMTSLLLMCAKINPLILTSVFVVMAPFYLKMTTHVEIRFHVSAGGYSHAGTTPI